MNTFLPYLTWFLAVMAVAGCLHAFGEIERRKREKAE